MHTMLNEELCPPTNSPIVEIQPPIQSIITLEYKGPTNRKESHSDGVVIKYQCQSPMKLASHNKQLTT